MKLFVFAHTPPPVHGQSVMVAALLQGLASDPEFSVVHINPRLSDDASDIGRWRVGKVFRLLGACARAWQRRLQHGPGVFYYVPAPGKRGALYRDFVVMLLCRPLFRRLVLHWHAVGLGDWLEHSAWRWERALARWLLGRAAAAIVLAPELAADAAALRPRQILVAANGAPDPGPPPPRRKRQPGERINVLFVGLCSRSKGVFAALEAAALANLNGHPVHFTAAGSFADPAERREFLQRAEALGPRVAAHAGPVGDSERTRLLQAADIFCYPTQYPYEGQPLAIVEALAADLPVVATRWRAIPGMLPPGASWLVDPEQPVALAAALIAAAEAGPAAGAARSHYLAHFTLERHLAAMKAALRSAASA